MRWHYGGGADFCGGLSESVEEEYFDLLRTFIIYGSLPSILRNISSGNTLFGLFTAGILVFTRVTWGDVDNQHS
jgi:hypothetical protein